MNDAADRAAVKRMREPRPGFATDRPQAVSLESERFGREVRRVATVFLTGAECPLACVMCDLWQHTNPGPTPPGSIPRQLVAASADCEAADWVKLYNASNFFDPAAVPPSDYRAIAAWCERYDRVVVENHPRFDNRHLREFRKICPAKLELAVGLETTDDAVLRLLDKRFSAAEAELCIRRWIDFGCDVRAFLLIRPPGAPGGGAGLEHTLRSAATAFSWDVRHVSLIPMRADWGPVRRWVATGEYQPPGADDVEWVAAESHRLPAAWQSVSVDLWDWSRVRGCCDLCRESRRNRLERWNLEGLRNLEGLPDRLSTGGYPESSSTCRCAGV